MIAEGTLSPEVLADRRRDALLLAPVFVLVPVAFWLAFVLAGIPMNWRAFGLGALGWWVALLLRGPVALVAKRFGTERANTIIVAASGPCEELVRLGAVALTTASLPWAASLGQGWAAIEVLFTIVTVFLQLAIMQRTDEKSRQAREMLAAQSQQTAGIKGGKFLGVMERIFASAMHIGFTLLVAAHPLLVLLLMPAHSLVNLGISNLAKRKVVLAETLMAAVGTVALALGVLVHTM